MFYDYMAAFGIKDMRKALIDLFKILNIPEKDRDPYDRSVVSEFPYVNGGLFDGIDNRINRWGLQKTLEFKFRYPFFVPVCSQILPI